METYKSSEIMQKDMRTLQTGFALYCRLLGIRQDTCVALALLLNAKWPLVATMKFMAEKDAERVQDTMVPEDITTMVVLKAQEYRDQWEEAVRDAQM